MRKKRVKIDEIISSKGNEVFSCNGIWRNCDFIINSKSAVSIARDGLPCSLVLPLHELARPTAAHTHFAAPRLVHSPVIAYLHPLARTAATCTRWPVCRRSPMRALLGVAAGVLFVCLCVGRAIHTGCSQATRWGQARANARWWSQTHRWPGRPCGDRIGQPSCLAFTIPTIYFHYFT